MKSLFELMWKEWDSKLTELEEKGETRLVDSREEARYLQDIIEQNIAEMKELRAQLALHTAEKGRMTARIAAIKAKRALFRKRVVALFRRYRKKAAALEAEIKRLRMK